MVLLGLPCIVINFSAIQKEREKHEKLQLQLAKSEQLREGLAASQKKLAEIEEKRRKEISEKQNLDNLIHTLQAQISNLKSNAKKLEKDKGVYLYLLDKKK